MPTETTAAERWLYSKLSHLLSGRVYSYIIPQDATLPAVVFQLISAQGDTIAVGNIRIFSRLSYSVKVVGPGSDLIALQP